MVPWAINFIRELSLDNNENSGNKAVKDILNILYAIDSILSLAYKLENILRANVFQHPIS